MRIVLQDYKYGRIMRPAGDYFIGDSIALYGEYSEEEIDLYRQFVKEGDLVLDIGANIGACTIPLAQMVGPKGCVYAFEPQRVIYQMLCGNLMLNNLMNVYAKDVGVGKQVAKTKILDIEGAGTYGTRFNTGNYSIENFPGDYEIDIITIDDLHLPKCDFIKCDTEGMGYDVLKGAEQTIRKFKPIMYIEQENGEKKKALMEFLNGLGYTVYKYSPALFRENNCFGDQANFYLTDVNNYVGELRTNYIANYGTDVERTIYFNFDWLCVPPGIKVMGKEDQIERID